MLEMAMTPEEQKELWSMKSQIDSLFNVIIGDKLNKQPGFAERLTVIEEKQDAMGAKVNRLTYIAIGIGIGILIGGAIFGYLSWKQVADTIKMIK